MNEAELLDPPPLEIPSVPVIKIRGEPLTELPEHPNQALMKAAYQLAKR